MSIFDVCIYLIHTFFNRCSLMCLIFRHIHPKQKCHWITVISNVRIVDNLKWKYEFILIIVWFFTISRNWTHSILTTKYWVSCIFFFFFDLHQSVEQILQFSSIHCNISGYDVYHLWIWHTFCFINVETKQHIGIKALYF